MRPVRSSRCNLTISGRKWNQGLKMVAMFLASQAVIRVATQYVRGCPILHYLPLTPVKFAPKPTAPAPAAPAATGPPSGPLAAHYRPGPTNAHAFWPAGTPLELYLFVTELDPAPSKMANVVDAGIEPSVKWDIVYGDTKWHRDIELMIDVPERVRAANGTWWADIFLKPVADVPGLAADHREAHYRQPLTKYMPKKKVRKERLLVGGEKSEDEEPEEDTGPQPWIPHWQSNITLALVGNGQPLSIAAQPPAVRRHVQYVDERPAEVLEKERTAAVGASSTTEDAAPPQAEEVVHQEL